MISLDSRILPLEEYLLPNGACSGRIKYGFVIDLDKARRRLRGRQLAPAGPPPITRALALADELRRLLETESVNQSQLTRRFGMSRARANQLIWLHHLHPAIQEYLRSLRRVGRRCLTERRLRPISYLDPDKQCEDFVQLRLEFSDRWSHIKAG